MNTIPRLDHIEWEDVSADTGDKRGTRLLARIIILGTNMHLEAMRIANDDGIQHCVNEDDQRTFELMHQATGGDGPWEVTVINGIPYILHATPYCS